MKKKISHHSELDSFDTVEELTTERQALVKKAKSALDSSYSPYSGFRVAAALKLTNGEIVLGSNQENIAYPSGLCAERVAIFSAGTNFPGVEISEIAIVAKSHHGEVTDPVTPCGACRQVMIELESNQTHPVTVIMTGENGHVWVSKSVSNLIPFYFSSILVGRAE
jgi:cytidine deaminase